MAYIPMTIGGKKYSETSLWTNPSPTSNFATQNIILSESMTNYKYLLVKWKTDTSTNQIGEIIVPVDNFKSQTVSPYYNYPAMETNSANYFRAFVYTSDTQIMMANCFKLNGGTTAYNQYNIPTEVLGLNELDRGKSSEIIKSIGSSAYSGATSIDITVEDLSKYTHLIFCVNITNTPLITAGNAMVCGAVPVEYFKSNDVSGVYTTGNSGSATFNNVTFTYINNTTVRVTRTNTTNRLFSVFGIQ